ALRAPDQHRDDLDLRSPHHLHHPGGTRERCGGRAARGLQAVVPKAASVRVPASSANLGPGFDVLALALDLHLEVAAREAPTTTWRPRYTAASASPRSKTAGCACIASTGRSAGAPSSSCPTRSPPPMRRAGLCHAVRCERTRSSTLGVSPNGYWPAPTGIARCCGAQWTTACTSRAGPASTPTSTTRSRLPSRRER